MAKRREPTKASRKSTSPSETNEFCYKVSGKIDKDIIINHLEKKIYRNPKFESAFKSNEDLPFSFLFPKSGNIICIKIIGRAKKNIERIENIHSKLTQKDLSFKGISLEHPEPFVLEQCNWWGGECKFGEIQKWKTLSHNGPYFKDLLEPYIPHKAPFIYAGKKYILTPKEEKVANYYARRILSERSPGITVFYTQDISGKGKDKIFNENFWNDFQTYLSPEHKKIFVDWKKANFEKIADKLEEAKKSKTKEEEKKRKDNAAEIKHDYGYAEINGITEPLGNYIVEPASIFMGRGENPKRGKIKREIEPEDVTINISRGIKVPEPPKGHKWGKIIHDDKVSWIASWKDTITGEPKYVLFSAEGQLKGKSDFMKYEKARKLNHFIEKVRNEYNKDINSSDLIKRQLGTVIYLIDHFGLRAGGEKSKEETDTVGASTLRVEHIKLKAPDKIIFDFLGKDSVRYYKEMTVNKDIYRNIAEFVKGKKPDAQLFNKISASDINSYLKSFDKNFTAKVFRTRLASVLMYDELKKIKIKKGELEADKKLKFDKANVAVAEILNHQRTVSAKNEEAISKLQNKLKELKKELKEKKASGKSIESIQKRINTVERNINSKKDTLNVAMSTSRTNYIDPRIVVAWCLKNDLDISKVYTAPNQRKFKWAIDTTGPDWDYFTAPLPVGMETLNPVDIIEPKSGVSRSPRRKSVENKVSKPKIQVIPTKPKKLEKQEKSFVSLKKHELFKPLEFREFSKISFAVIGGSKEQINLLRELGGIYNPNILGKNIPGFIFKNNREEEIKNAVGYVPPEMLHKEPLVSFYLGQSPSHRGYTLEEILSWNDQKLEQKHDFIQTLFPLKSKSVYAPGSEILSTESLNEFRTNDVIRYNVYRAYMKMMDFFGYNVNIVKRTIDRTSDIEALMNEHNYLRISRMLTFLTMANFRLLALLLFLGLCEDLKSNELFREKVIASNSLKKWMVAIGIPIEKVKNYNGFES